LFRRNASRSGAPGDTISIFLAELAACTAYSAPVSGHGSISDSDWPSQAPLLSTGKRIICVLPISIRHKPRFRRRSLQLPKEGQVISKNSKSQAKLVHGIQVVIARNYIENLREEVKKGMREKAEQGIYPSRPPLGYQNNKLEHSIEIDQNKAQVARRMFELYASGQYSLSSLRVALKKEFGVHLAAGYLARLLKNPFYIGQFYWEDKLYTGTHTSLVSSVVFEQVQRVFRGHNKPRYGS